MKSPTLPVLAARELVMLADVMSHAIVTVHDGCPLEELLRLLVERETPALIVLDRLSAARSVAAHPGEAGACERGRVSGLVTRLDVLEALREQPDATAIEIMSFAPMLSAESSVECAAALMVVERVGYVVVVDASRNAIGLVSALDIAKRSATQAGYLISTWVDSEGAH